VMVERVEGRAESGERGHDGAYKEKERAPSVSPVSFFQKAILKHSNFQCSLCRDGAHTPSIEFQQLLEDGWADNNPGYCKLVRGSERSTHFIQRALVWDHRLSPT